MADRFYSVGVQDAVSKEWRTIRELPSVTTILGHASKDALVPWATNLTIEGVSRLIAEGKVPENPTPQALKDALKEHKLRHWDLRDQAADRGTLAHDFVESLIAFGPEGAETDDPWQQSLIAWWKIYKPEVLQSEIPVVCLEDGYAGRIDLLASVQGQRGGYTLIDFKTLDSKKKFSDWPSAYDSNRVQLCVYRKALLEENPNLNIERLAVVRLAPEGYDHYSIPPETWDMAVEYFKGCLSIYKYRDATEKKKWSA